MKIDSTEFGSITVNGTTYAHDILIQLSGEVVKRKKKLSKKHYGTSHIISLEEAAFVFEKAAIPWCWGRGNIATSNYRRRPPNFSNITVAG
jgi:hypothetical protein